MPLLELPSLSIDVVAATMADSRPVLINRHPGPDEQNVPLDWTIALDIVDPGPDGIDRTATQVLVDGTLAYDSGILSGFNGPDANENHTVDSLRIVLDPVVPFASQATIEVHVVSQTVGGAHILDETYAFTAEDRTAPRVIAAQAIGQRAVRIAFDEAVQITDYEGFLFEPLDQPAVPIAPVGAVAQGSVIEVTLNTEMTPDVRYRVIVSGATDLNNNSVLPPYNTVEFIGFRPTRPPNRRFNLWEMIPKHNRREDDTGDLWRFIACLQEVTDLILAEVDRFINIFDIERAPETFLDLILKDLGNPFLFDLDEIGKRRLASVLMELYAQTGTAIGIKNAIRFFMGIEVEILPFTADVMSLGESLLGVDWILGPSNRFALYAFNVRVDHVLTDTRRKQIRAIVNQIRPSHTHFVDLVEPVPPPTFNHWELGVSELNESTILH